MKVKRILLALFVLVVSNLTAFAQTGATGSGFLGSRRHVLTIESNVRGAQVFVNAVLQKGVTPMQLTLAVGSYSITVRADGYKDYVANVNLTRDVTLNANLQPIAYTLTVTSNTAGSSVYINGDLRGRAPARLNLPQGRYTVEIRADNHYSFNQIVDLTRDVAVNAQLETMTFRLNVTSNVQGADVYLDNQAIGRAPMRAEVNPGTYTLRVNAAGFFEFSQVITIQENFNINVNLRKQVASVSFSVPQAYLNPAVKDPLKLFTFYVDGRQVRGSLAEPFEVEAGERMIRVQTGGVIFEGVYVIAPGMEYVLELNPLLLLSPAPEKKATPAR